MADGRRLLEELKRRHVWRVAIAYVVTAWVVLQLASVMLPSFGAPGWVMRVLFGILVILFPIALILAWAFEITPEGVRRTEPATSSESRTTGDTRAMGRKLNTGIIVALVIAVVLLVGNQFLWHRGMHAPAVASNPGASVPAQPLPSSGPAGATPAADAPANAVPPPAPTATIPQKSVAVLPFTNEGANSEQFFSDGLSEDLINALSQFDGLKVISRNSAFQFRNSKDTAAKIGQLLGVAHLLEGSVQRAGDEVRITVTLVNAADGSTLWSQQYDKPYQDLFALQDTITQAVAGALQVKLVTVPGAVAQSDRPPSGNLAAYAAYQHGIAFIALHTESGARQAVDAFEQAALLDPQYAAAYAQLSLAWGAIALMYSRETKGSQARTRARGAASTALKLNSDSVLAHLAIANLMLFTDMDWTGAEKEARRALQLSPNNADAQFSLGYTLATLGHVRRAVVLTLMALENSPRRDDWLSWLGVYFSAEYRINDAKLAIDSAIAMQPDVGGRFAQLTLVEVQRGDAKAALATARMEQAQFWRDYATALALQVATDSASADAALREMVANYATAAPYQIAQIYALRRDPDAMFHWLDRARANRDPSIQQLLYDPLILRYRDDPRFADFCRKVGLPATTDAVAMK